MKNAVLSIMFMVASLPSCSHFDIVRYQPNLNHNQPQSTIERVLREQPPSWGDVPYQISVKDDRIEMRIFKEGGPLPVVNPGSEVSMIIYYKNVGTMVLHKHRSGVWYVEIYDSLGYWLYSVNCYNEDDAKGFIDALYTVRAALN